MTDQSSTSVSDPRPSPLTLGTKLLILGGGPAAALAVSAIAPILPQIDAELARTAQEQYMVKMLVGIVGAAMVIGAPLTGFLSDRIGLKRVLIANYLLLAVAGLAGIVLNEIHALVVARFLVGLAGAGAVTASVIIINRRLPAAARAGWLGAYIAVAYLSTLLAQPLVGLVAEIDWHLAFSVYAIGIPFALIAMFGFEDEAGDDSRLADGAKGGPLLSWFPFRFAVVALITGCITYIPMIYTPFLLKELGVSSPSRIAFVLTVDSVAGILTALAYGHARRFISERVTFLLSFVLTAIGGAVAASANDYTVVLIGTAITGLGVGWFMPTLMELLGSRVEPHQQGRAAGLVKAASYLSTTLCVLATEPLSQLYGPRAPLLVGSLLALGLLVLLSLQLLNRRGRPIGQPAPSR